MPSIRCNDCGNDIPQPASCCPHCGRWSQYWNVINAGEADERTALKDRYDAAKANALARGADAAVQDFETAVADSKAVIARSIEEVQRLARSTHEIFGPYYLLIAAELKLPDGDEWDIVRQLADTVLFPHHKEHIRFAALSLDGIGLSKYGGCSIQIRNDMIAHRASVIEENSALFMERHGVKVARDPGMPKGYLAPWAERDKICTAKLAARIDSTTTRNQYSSLLLKQGATSADDEFVEVHIWGPMTVLSIEKVTITDSKGASETRLNALISQLKKHGVTVA
jgi:hypothetical protein